MVKKKHKQKELCRFCGFEYLSLKGHQSRNKVCNIRKFKSARRAAIRRTMRYMRKNKEQFTTSQKTVSWIKLVARFLIGISNENHNGILRMYYFRLNNDERDDHLGKDGCCVSCEIHCNCLCYYMGSNTSEQKCQRCIHFKQSKMCEFAKEPSEETDGYGWYQYGNEQYNKRFLGY